VSLPGPTIAVWGLELLAFAIAITLVGEAVRSVGSRYAPILRIVDPWERALLDLYLGGALVYLLAWVPGLLGPFTIPVLAILAVSVLLYARMRSSGPDRGWPRVRAAGLRWSDLAVVATVIGVFVVELVELGGVPSGNTWDASVLTTYGALLQNHHALGLSLSPVASGFVTYPQGSVVWITTAQQFAQLPPARSALLLDPMFLALAPVGAYVVGRRWLEAPHVGAAFALVVGVLGSWTRLLVSGSYDFVFAFPLILLLAGWSIRWVRGSPLRWADVVVFGAVMGYSAAMNPVGAEWIALFLPITAAFLHPRFANDARAWLKRWVGALGVAALFVAPNLVAIGLAVSVGGPARFGMTPAHPASAGILLAQFVGGIDPFLFRPHDLFLSPFPVLRGELAALLTLTALWPWIPPWRRYLPAGWSEFGRWIVAAGVSAVGLVGVGLVGAGGNPYAGFVSSITSSGEATVLLFSLFTFAAAIPLVVVLARAAPPSPNVPSDPVRSSVPPPRRGRPLRRPIAASTVLAFGIAAALVTPGVVVFPTSFPDTVRQLSGPFGNLTVADFDLLQWVGAHLPSGARILVAPGGALDFLPGYAPTVVVLYPLVNGESSNGSYRTAVAELTNGTLDRAGLDALAELQVGFVGVTQANSVLWPPFVATPMLTQPGNFSIAFHEADAYLFARV
jgi:hypothetical protein